jgi:small-conductance mechanosensitive channel
MTPDNTVLIVPNSKFIEGIVTNWSVIDPKIRILIPVRVGYKSDVELVSKLLMQSAADYEGVLDDPAPSVIFRAFGDYGLNLELSVWIAQPDPKIRTKTISDLNYAVDKLLKENGITVPFQQFSTYQ